MKKHDFESRKEGLWKDMEEGVDDGEELGGRGVVADSE